MNLKKKKELAARTLNVGKDRIIFAESRIDDIKEAITKQDIKDLYSDKAILIKNKKGRRKVLKKKKLRRGVGNVRKKARNKKKEYVIITRKLRRYLKQIKEEGRISNEDFKEIRKKIRNRIFKSKASLKEHIEGLNKI